MTLNLRLAILGLLSISATVTSDRAAASSCSDCSARCAQPCCDNDAMLPQLPPGSSECKTVEARIIDITDNA